MGSSLPPDVPFDLVASYARLRGDTAELVLGDPTSLPDDDQVVAVLRMGDRRVRARADLVEDAAGRRLVISCPRRRLSYGTWSITLRSAGHRERVPARLLVQGRRPLVLLWGAKGFDSRPAVPHAERHPPGLPRRLVSRLRGAARRLRR